MADAFTVRAIDAPAAPLATLHSVYRLGLVSGREYWPERDPVPFDEPPWRLRSTQHERFDWLVEDATGEVIAAAGMNFGKAETNRHLAHVGGYVHPDHRRRGIGTALLDEAIAETRRQGRSTIILWTGSQVPAGEAFVARTGAEMALEGRLNRLDVARLDLALLDRMIAAGTESGRGFSLGWWIDTLPEEELEAVAKLFDAMNAQPRGKLKVEDHHLTADQLREGLRDLAANRVSRWVLYAREEATGVLAGFTEVFWHPDRPVLLNQGNTGVLPAFRGHGLGRLLKATMLKRVLAERPMVHTVDTSNADSNAPMLKINTELGFRLHSIGRTWQLEI